MAKIAVLDGAKLMRTILSAVLRKPERPEDVQRAVTEALRVIEPPLLD